MRRPLIWTWSVFVPGQPDIKPGYFGCWAETEDEARKLARDHFGLLRLPRGTFQMRHRLVCIPRLQIAEKSA